MTYDPMQKPPTATPVGQGSGAGNPTIPASAPRRTSDTNATAGRSIADAMAEAMRPKGGANG